MRLPGIGGLYAPGQGWFPEYTEGLYIAGETSMIVGRGIGDSTELPRVFNPPEISTIILNKAE